MRFHARCCPSDAEITEANRQTRLHLAFRRHAEAKTREAQHTAARWRKVAVAATARRRQAEASAAAMCREYERRANNALRLAEQRQQREADLRRENNILEHELQRAARRVNEWQREADSFVDKKRPLPVQRTETPAGAVEGEATTPAGQATGGAA